MIGTARGTANRPQKRSHKVARYPAPIAGMDVSKSLGEMALNSCVYTYNIMPLELGMKVRSGYREHQIAIESAAGEGDGVHTVIPFDSVTEDGSKNKIFAVTNEGIWDTTAEGGTPSLVVTFGTQSSDAGYGTYAHYVDQGENDVLFYADSVNGLFKYKAADNSWANTSITTGITEANVRTVTTFKNNVWFTLADSTVGYYLPVLASTGTVAAQYFGDKFQHGGSLAGIFSWSVDGGAGLDDILVAVSTAGDVLVYAGSGPEADDWAMRGIYYIGEIPNSVRFGTEQGGELYLLSALGITSLSDLLSGVDTSALSADIQGASMAYKIAGSVRDRMKKTINLRGWEVATIPSEGGILVTSPQINNDAPIQYFYSLATRGWGIWRDIPLTCFSEYKDNIYFGTADNRLMILDGNVDDALLSPENAAYNGNPIEFSILTAFSTLELDVVYKRVKLIRPDFLAGRKPEHSSLIRYDFNIDEGLTFGLTDSGDLPVMVWDTGKWDEAVWGSENGAAFPSIGGTWGYGRYIAIATKGKTESETRLIGWDLVFDVGGPML